MRPTGVALLDDVLGGLSPGFPLVLVGPTGSGRTVLCLQLAEAACGRGEAVAVLTGEPARLLLRQASSMGLDLAPPLRDGRLALLELDPQIASTARVHGGEALVDAIHQSAPEAGILLIDPLTSLTAEVMDEVAVRALVRAIFDRATAVEQTVVVTIERERLADDAVLDRVLKEACGAIVELERSEDGLYVLDVPKSRVAGCEPGPVHFSIGAGGATRVSLRSTDGGHAEPSPPVASPLAALQRARVQWSDVAGEPNSVAAEPARESDAPASAPPGPDAVVRGGAERHPACGPSPRPSSTAAVSEPDRTPSRAGASAPVLDAAPVAPARSRPRVLVVDDDALAREMLSDWLSDRYELFVADDGFAAMSAVLAHAPDLIILDLVLPRVDGYELMRALRGAGSRAPVLVVSGSLARAVDRVRALVLGASDTLPKPVQRFELTRKVETLLRAPASPPCELDPEDVEALLGGATSTRILDELAFRERLERACRFGDEFGLGSALVAIETPSPAALEALVAAAGSVLRAEDAACVVAERRSLLLLVATELDMVPRILGRFRGSMGRRGGAGMKGYRWFAERAESIEDGKPWDRLFEHTVAWPSSGGEDAARR